MRDLFMHKICTRKFVLPLILISLTLPPFDSQSNGEEQRTKIFSNSVHNWKFILWRKLIIKRKKFFFFFAQRISRLFNVRVVWWGQKSDEINYRFSFVQFLLYCFRLFQRAFSQKRWLSGVFCHKFHSRDWNILRPRHPHSSSLN